MVLVSLIEIVDNGNMQFDQLRVFVAVAERGHVTRAAELLGMSQSAVSAAIKSLEQRYDVRLFNRVGRSIELSQAGSRFLPEARAVLDCVAIARLTLENVAQSPTGRVSIAASQTIASYWLPTHLASFHESYPAVRLDVSIANTRQVEALVLDGAADIGLVEGRTESDLLKSLRVATDELVLITGASDIEQPVDLLGLRWILREQGSGTREVFEDFLAREGRTIDELQLFLVLPNNEAIRQAVEAGAGATVISKRVVRGAISRGAVRVLNINLPDREFVLISHRDRTATLAQKALKDHLAHANV